MRPGRMGNIVPGFPPWEVVVSAAFCGHVRPHKTIERRDAETQCEVSRSGGCRTSHRASQPTDATCFRAHLGVRGDGGPRAQGRGIGLRERKPCRKARVQVAGRGGAGGSPRGACPWYSCDVTCC